MAYCSVKESYRIYRTIYSLEFLFNTNIKYDTCMIYSPKEEKA